MKIQVRPTDWIFGDGNLKLRGISTGNWLPYIEFFERQMLNTGDTDGCVCFSTQESFDAQIEFLISEGAIPAGTIELFNQLGYMDTNSLDGKAHFHTSPRWLEILTGNGLNGNSVQDAAQAIRNFGVLPYMDLPVDPTMTPEEYVNPSAITQAMKDKAAQLFAAIGGKNSIQYSWVTNGSENFQAMVSALPQAPLLLGVNVGDNWNASQPTPPPTGSNPGHCVMGFATIAPDDMRIYDHYEPNPKDLISYPIWFALSMVVTVNPPPPSPLPPSNPTVPTTLTWLEKLQAFWESIVESITPEGRAKLGGVSRSGKWPALRKAFLKGKVCGICGGTKKLEAHHVIPFSVDASRELDITNLYPLCEGKKSVNCHLIFGHYGNFAEKYNKDIHTEAPLWKGKITAKNEKDLSTSTNP